MTKMNAREDASPFPLDRTPTPHESPSLGAVRADSAPESSDDESAALERRITENHENAIAHAEQAAGILQDAKMSREALATLLSEMASRVVGK